ncbi:MAG: hypothetical protein NTZ85_00750 [Bacteroidia bacterium]|jgi:hypothetical protein|nr:hypothetical protein [Bacteroidia bacterium]
MKRGVVVLIIMMILSSLRVSAQNPNLEKLNSYKIAFFTQKLNLTPQEAEKFWPLYNDYQDRKNKIQVERVQMTRTVVQNGANMSDKELTELGDKYFGLEIKEADLSKEFYNNMKGILPPLKILKFYQVENQYKLVLLNELQQRRQVRNNQLQR